MNAIWTLSGIATLLALSRRRPGRSERTLVGTWRLASASSSTDKAVFGQNPTGFLTYTPEGRMSALVAYDGRPLLSNSDILAASAEERDQAFSTFFAYAGPYTFTGDQVIHHVEIASIQNWVNTNLTRDVTFEGKYMILRTPPITSNGVLQTFKLAWERVK